MGRGRGPSRPDDGCRAGAERRWWGEETGVSEGVRGDLAEPETGKGRRLQGVGPVLLASTSFTPEVSSPS